jgi:hypothetical protein
MFFLIPTSKGWNQVLMCTGPISVQLCSLHATFYSSKHESIEIIDPTMTSPNQDPKCATKFTYSSSYLLLNNGIKSLNVLVQYQSSSGHYILHFILPNMNIKKWQTQPWPVAPNLRPRTCYKFYMFFLMPTPKAWNQVLICTVPI